MKYFILLIIISTKVLATDFKGQILSDSEKEPIIGASLRIENTALGDYTDKMGNFEIRNLNPGNYNIIIWKASSLSKKACYHYLTRRPI